jgi:hypothetical protein
MPADSRPPGEQDARDPAPRADPGQHQVAGHFEQAVAEEENAGAPAERVSAQAEVLVHGQGGEADIDAVDIGQHVQGHEQGHEAPEDLAHHLLFVDGFHRCLLIFHISFCG